MDFENYYVNQAGSGLSGFHGVKWQRGHGFFGRLFQMVLPVLRRALPVVGKHALSTGISIGKDLVAGENFKSSLKNRLKEAGSNLLDEAESGLQSLDQKGRGRKRKRKMPFFQPGNPLRRTPAKRRKRRGRKRKKRNAVSGGLKSIKRKTKKRGRKKRKSRKSSKLASFLS